MKIHTSGFKDNIKTLGREIDVKITYVEQTLDMEDLNYVKPRFNTELFKTIMKVVEFDSNVKIDAKQWIDVEIGVKVGDEYEYLDFGNYYINDDPEFNVDTSSYLYKAYDKMIESMVYYDENPLEIIYPISYKNLIIAICDQLNWTYELPTTFPNMNTEITSDLYIGLGMTYRDILDDLCPASMGNFINDGAFKIIYPNETDDTIDDEFLNEDNITIGKKIGPVNALVLARAEGGDTINRRDENSISLNGLNEIKIKDNILLSSEYRENFIDEMFNKIKGFEYYAIDIMSKGVMYYDPLDMFTINHNGVNYKTIALNDELNIEDGIEEIFYTPELEEVTTDYSTSSQTDKARKMATIIAYKNQAKINLTAQELSEEKSKIADLQITTSGLEVSVSQIDNDVNGPSGLSSKTAQLSLDVSKLRSEIGDVTDITTQEEGNGQLEFLDVNASEPINITIRPTLHKDISYIYPSSNLFPSPSLFPQNRILRFYNETTEETFDYILPGNLRYYDADNFDEFYLDYGTSTCQIIRKVDIDANGVKTAKSTPVTENYTYPSINLTDGNYTVTMLGYPNSYLKIRLMSKNMYTSQFATRVELNSSINQSATEINIEVAKKVGNNEIISKINQSAEAIMIDANKINLTGKTINLTSDDIKISSTNFNVTKDGVVTANQLKANNADITGKITATSGSFSGTIYSGSGNIGGWSLTGSYLYSASANVVSYIYSNGNVIFGGNYGLIKFDTDPVRITTSNKLLISDNYSASSLPSSGDTLALRAYNGTIHINSNYGVYANNTLLASGSSRKMKRNIKLLSKNEKTELYNVFKGLKSYKYDYKKKYASGQKNNYGFIIEEFENSVLGKILHVNKGIDDENTKYFSHDDLTRVNSIIIQEMIKKIEKLEEILNGKTN